MKNNMYLYDYHMHSINSMDGKSTVSEMCISSVDAGMKEIAVTDHFEPCLREENVFYNAENYFLDIEKMRSVLNGKIKIRSGVELGQPHLYPDLSEKLISSYPYDYVLASVHKLKGGTDFGEFSYNTGNVSFYCERYLDELKLLAEWNKFDCMGHLDLVKRYAANHKTKADLMLYKERVEEILKILIKNGKGIEVNTSGLRQSAKECMPGYGIIRLYKELGGEIITVGSDAHISNDAGKGIMEAIQMIEFAGFKFMTVYKNRQPSMIKISDHPSILSVGMQSA